MATLTFELTAQGGGPCDFNDFSEFTSSLKDALKVVHRAKVPAGRLPRYRIVRLQVGSALAGLLGDGPAAAVVINDFIATIVAIREQRRPGIDISGDDIRTLKKLAEPLDSKTATIELNSQIPIDHKFVLGCEVLLAGAPKSYGQAIGRLEGMNIHSRRYFRLYPEGIDRGAECHFAEEWYQRVMLLMGRRVRVEGLIHRDPDGVGIDRISEIRSLEGIPESDELPTFQSLLGLFAGEPIDIGAGWED